MTKKRVLIICTHFRRDRIMAPRRAILQPMAGVHIASQIDKDKYEVELYHEDWHGAFDTSKPREHDLVFLSGLQPEFDRMRQLSYYFRKWGSLVVAGGSICTLFPAFAANFFDVVCAGGVDSVSDFLADYERGCIKSIYVSSQSRMTGYRISHEAYYRAGICGPAHLIEASRGCNFLCDFCVIPAEKAKHASYSVDHVAAAIEDSIALAPLGSMRRQWPVIWFIDNNFSQNRRYVLELCRYLKSNQKVKAWGALVTQNTLQDRDLIARMADAKCCLLFTGIESLDPEFLKLHNKKQNLSKGFDPRGDIQFAERSGICITYPYLFDPRISTAAEMREQIDVLARQPGFPLPVFMSFVSPLAGTGLFWDSVRKNELRPNLALRDLDGETVAYRNAIDTPENLGRFAHAVFTNPGSVFDRDQFWWSTLHRMTRARSLDPIYLWSLLNSNFRIFQTANIYRHGPVRSYMGGDKQLDPQYETFPADISSSDLEQYFEPTKVADLEGAPASWIARYAPQPVRAHARLASAR